MEQSKLSKEVFDRYSRTFRNNNGAAVRSLILEEGATNDMLKREDDEWTALHQASFSWAMMGS